MGARERDEGAREEREARWPGLSGGRGNLLTGPGPEQKGRLRNIFNDRVAVARPGSSGHVCHAGLAVRTVSCEACPPGDGLWCWCWWGGRFSTPEHGPGGLQVVIYDPANAHSLTKQVLQVNSNRETFVL